ncbi:MULTISPECIES: nitroreductase family deazaflavin-dependent oxidoreductase [Mycobacteriaceae]|uniref:Nitroreductase family deazaflavin-dependent oxidoreductase n=1 Tax=Mycolicibacterium parafortuitum TaxID=39692 RepID=A0ACC6MP77_MYCPF|nr:MULTISPECIES: nitroreductase family deazaflavin-dependent oxidoreductase [Mycobacteriaceae]MDZ5088803.1 nitroreductase family deazaflavin-dependent oxidoreductase [Mycolicibacterium parafortuitum]GFM18159.1 deazaflavin-dependent nitroreductase family protein [Mycobacterium sp. PO1]GFM25730.1 deazaflavin-dependent nitroreductase family protein [Mycobacterium sp. PO2]
MSELPRMFPEWLDRIQIKYFNPIVKPLAGRMPGLSVIKHRGRTSGRPYETIVTAYRNDSQLAIVLGHGKTDWAKNVLAAGEADVTMSGDEVHIVNPRIAPSGDGVEALPGFARRQARKVAVFVADVQPKSVGHP